MFTTRAPTIRHTRHAQSRLLTGRELADLLDRLAALDPSGKQNALKACIRGLSEADRKDLVPQLVQGLGNGQEKAAAHAAAATLSDEDKKDLIPQLVQGLENNEQKAAVQEAAATLSDADKKDLVPQLTRDLGEGERTGAVHAAAETLPDKDKEAVAEGLFGNLDVQTRRRIWYIVIATLTAAVSCGRRTVSAARQIGRHGNPSRVDRRHGIRRPPARSAQAGADDSRGNDVGRMAGPHRRTRSLPLLADVTGD